jgi:hypothetical protein
MRRVAAIFPNGPVRTYRAIPSGLVGGQEEAPSQGPAAWMHRGVDVPRFRRGPATSGPTPVVALCSV